MSRRAPRAFRLHCANWAMVGNARGFSGGIEVEGWSRARRVAHRLAQREGCPCRLYTPSGRLLLGEVTPKGQLRLLQTPAPWQMGLSALRHARVA